jgi:tetratricopeptide (TPR) repeat protein
MDCRFAFLLLFAALANSLGCTSTHPAVASSAKPPTKEPSPELLVSMAGNMMAQAAAPTLLPVQRRDLREQARMTYEQALHHSKDYLPALKGLVEVYIVTDDQEHAIAASQRAYEVAPKDADLRLDIGKSWARSDKWEPAIQCMRDALSLDPSNHNYAKTLGVTLACAGKYGESLECFRLVGMAEPEAHFNLALTLHHLHHDDQCRSELSLVLQTEPTHAGAQKLQAELGATATQ